MNRHTHPGGRARPRNGVTLIELLVVLAIIGVLLGVAVPTFMTSGAMDVDPLKTSARDLFRILRSANIYALRHNVNTAVVYAIEVVEDPLRRAAYDSPAALWVPRITGYAVVRELTEDEIGALKLTQDDLPAFTPLEAEQGDFTRFENDGVLAHAPYAPLDAVNMLGRGESAALNYNIGLVPIKLYEVKRDVDTGGLYGERVQPPVIHPEVAEADQGDGDYQVVPPQLYAAGEPPRLHYGWVNEETGAFSVDRYAFPAHVFRSDGVMAKSARTPKERVTIAMAPGPETLESERYIEPPTLDNPAGIRLPYQLIEVYAASGRVKWAGEESLPLPEETP